MGTPFGNLWPHFWRSLFQVTKKSKYFFGVRSWVGAILDTSGRRGELEASHPGGIWASWDTSGGLWQHLEASRTHLKASGRHLEASEEVWRHLGDIWRYLEDIQRYNLGDIWRHVGSWDSGRHLGGICRHLGDIWRHLGDIWRHLGSSGGF